MTDDEIDEMFQEQYGEREQRQGMAAGGTGGVVSPQTPPQVQPMGGMGGLPVYSLALAQTPSLAPTTGDGLLGRKLGPLPVWGWGLAALGVGVGGYFLWQQTSSGKKISANGRDDDSDNDGGRVTRPALPSGDEDDGPRTSRGDFAERLNGYFMRKGIGDKVHVFDDADEASKKLKQVSPLVNLKCEVAFKPDKDLEKICKREGLQPIAHPDGSIGFYPAKGKRGDAWKRYIDLLRDDGQKA